MTRFAYELMHLLKAFNEVWADLVGYFYLVLCVWIVAVNIEVEHVVPFVVKN